jgi:hypothetical protein
MWVNISQWLFLCSPLETTGCQGPTKQTFIYVQHRYRAPWRTLLALPVSGLLEVSGIHKGIPRGHSKWKWTCEDPSSKCVSYKNIYSSSCSMQTAICIYWFQMTISSSSSSPSCYINKSQPSGLQPATLKYVLTHHKSIRSKYGLTEFFWTKNCSELMVLIKLFKKCTLGVRT